MPPFLSPLRRPRAALALALVAAAVVALTAGLALGDSSPAPEAGDGRTLQVVGIADYRVAPDRAVLTVGVEHDADTAESARARATAALDAILRALRATGLPADHLQSDGLQIAPREDADGNRVPGYHAAAHVAVTVDDLERLGVAIDAAARAGANDIGEVTWTVRDARAVQREALQRAAADGRAQAEALARGAGVQVGDLLTAAAEGGSDEPDSEVAMRTSAPAAPDAVPVAPGELTGSVSVTMTWAIAG